MDRFETMSILVAVADGGSLSEASRKLKIPLASVSRKISEIEAHLNVKLLTRTTRSLDFTDYGKSYLLFCRRILEEVQEAERTITGEYSAPKGHLTITAPVVFGKLHLLPIITDFLKAYPDVDIQLSLSDRSVDLIEEKIDLALRIGELANSSLMAIRVGHVRQQTCANKEYLKKMGVPKTPKDLKDHHCITISSLGSSTKWDFPNGKLKTSVSIRSRLEVNSPEAGLEAALSGTGITRALSYQVAEYQKRGTLQILLKDFEPAPWPVHLVYPAGKIVAIKLRAFLDFATPRLRERLSKIPPNSK